MVTVTVVPIYGQIRRYESDETTLADIVRSAPKTAGNATGRSFRVFVGNDHIPASMHNAGQMVPVLPVLLVSEMETAPGFEHWPAKY